MPSKILDLDSETAERVIKTVNDQYNHIFELEGVVRRLESRIDNFVPVTMHLRVIPPSNIVWAAAIAGAAVWGYLAYAEVRRNRKDEA
jgi:hypothetical protein